MATLTKCNPRIVVWGDASYAQVRVADNQTWNTGEFLRANSSGLLVACATGADAGGGGIQYYAVEAQTDPNNNTTLADVVKIGADTVFEGNLHHDTPASALAKASVVGQQYALDVTSNVHTVDLEDTSNVAFLVTEIGSDYNEPENSAADYYGRVRFKVLTTVLQAAPAV